VRHAEQHVQLLLLHVQQLLSVEDESSLPNADGQSVSMSSQRKQLLHVEAGEFCKRLLQRWYILLSFVEHGITSFYGIRWSDQPAHDAPSSRNLHLCAAAAAEYSDFWRILSLLLVPILVQPVFPVQDAPPSLLPLPGTLQQPTGVPITAAAATSPKCLLPLETKPATQQLLPIQGKVTKVQRKIPQSGWYKAHI